MPATTPYRKKSYHSMVAPTRLANTTVRTGLRAAMFLPLPWVQLHIGLVFLQVAHGLRERVAAERVAQLLRDHHLEDGRLAFGLALHRLAQRVAHVRDLVDRHALAAERAGNRGPARVLELDALEALRIEVHVVL